jgi:hypothetical protein
MNKKHSLQRIHLNFPILVIAAVVLLMIAPLQQSSAHHQLEGEWETPQWIPGLFDTDGTFYPIFIDDGAGKLHVLHTQLIDKQGVIMYSQWLEGVAGRNRWTFSGLGARMNEPR